MATFTDILRIIKENDHDLNTKRQFVSLIVHQCNSKSTLPTRDDVEELTDFAFGEINSLLRAIAAAGSYREKEDLFNYENEILGLIVACHGFPGDLGAAQIEVIRELVETVNRERYVECAVDALFEDGKPDNAVQVILELVRPIKDEFHRSMLWHELLGNRDNFGALNKADRNLIRTFACEELERLLKSDPDADIVRNISLICSVFSELPIEGELVRLIEKASKLGNSHISFNALEALINAGATVPVSVIEALARDLEYSNMTFNLLRENKLVHLFPSEYAIPEQLAKSDMVHWLCYPTELGKAPDEIEYLGQVRKRGKYYIFRFRSDSDTLGDDCVGKWLIGWSDLGGHTFSNFDLYSDYEKKTIPATLRYIRRKLL